MFRKLLELAAADVGNLVNLTEWASLAQTSRNTAGRYLEIAEEAARRFRGEPTASSKRTDPGVWAW